MARRLAQAEGGKTELLYTFWGSAYEKAAQEGAIAMFNEQNPDIHVEALHIPSAGTEYIAKLTAMAASGTNPDIGYMDVATAFVWAKEGKFYNVFDLMEEDPDWGPEMYVDDIFYRYEAGKSFGTTSSINPRLILYNVDRVYGGGHRAAADHGRQVLDLGPVHRDREAAHAGCERQERHGPRIRPDDDHAVRRVHGLLRPGHSVDPARQQRRRPSQRGRHRAGAGRAGSR